MEIQCEQLKDHNMNTIEELHNLFPHWKRGSILKKVKETESGKDIRFVAKNKDKILGHLKFNLGKGLHTHRAELVSMIVLPEYRHQGIGKKLTFFAIKNLPKKIKLLILAVDKENKKAIRFYKKSGFEKYGFLKNASILNGKYIDNILMSKEI